MIDLIINLLTPIFVNMGASAADVGNYIRIVSSYIYVILGALAVMLLVMAAAHFVVKKGSRHLVRWSAGLAWVLVVLLCVNLICYGPLYATLSGVLNASKAEISDDVAGNSLANAGYTMNDELVNMYTGYCSQRASVTMQTQDWTLPEPTRGAYTSAVMSAAAAFSDTAVIVIGRTGGENADLPSDMNAVIHDTYDVAQTDAVEERSKTNYGYTNGRTPTTATTTTSSRESTTWSCPAPRRTWLTWCAPASTR